MAERAGLPEELRNLIGRTDEPIILEIERGPIRRFADTIDDPNPLYHDVEYAKRSKYGELICPPGFFGWPVKGIDEWGNRLRDEVMETAAKAGYHRLLDGGVEHEFYVPMRAGDTLVMILKVANMVERTGKTGKMLFVFYDLTYINQNGDLVVKTRRTIIHPA